MRTNLRRLMGAASLALVMANVGCQTYQLGQTLPSPGIMRDDLLYPVKGPDFPLANELAAQQAAEVERAGAVNRP
jgi:hypothetical protein